VRRIRVAGSAVDAAVAAQRELELPVRMGIATGEAELREADCFGAVLNRAARVTDAGHGGRVDSRAYVERTRTALM
jgi:class 3 adenylate cyclase